MRQISLVELKAKHPPFVGIVTQDEYRKAYPQTLASRRLPVLFPAKSGKAVVERVIADILLDKYPDMIYEIPKIEDLQIQPDTDPDPDQDPDTPPMEHDTGEKEDDVFTPNAYPSPLSKAERLQAYKSRLAHLILAQVNGKTKCKIGFQTKSISVAIDELRTKIRELDND